MSSSSRTLGLGLLLSMALAACGAGGDGNEPSLAEQPLNTDYSTLKAVESRPAPLEYAASDAQILAPLRNGVRMLVRNNGAPGSVFTASPPATDQYSATTVQVEGVAEADSVRYDGQYIYTGRSADPQSSSPPYVLAIARTDPVAATVQPVSTFSFDDKDSTTPQLYQLPASGGPADYIVAITQDVVAWHAGFLPIVALVQKPDHTSVQVLDVRDPQNVSQAWKLQLDGWLSASRLVGDTLYLVSSYRPRIPGLVLPADTLAKQEANERLIRSSTADQLMPHYSENGGASVGAYLLSVGQDVTPDGRRAGVKVELFDVRDIAHPLSLGAQVFGKAGTYTEGLDNPHALTFLEKTGSLRLAMPVDVYDTAWKYSGLHMLEVTGTDTASPQLHFQGVVKTGESGNTPYPPARYPKRAILHDDAVFGVHGDLYLSGRWQDLPKP